MGEVRFGAALSMVGPHSLVVGAPRYGYFGNTESTAVTPTQSSGAVYIYNYVPHKKRYTRVSVFVFVLKKYVLYFYLHNYNAFFKLYFLLAGNLSKSYPLRTYHFVRKWFNTAIS